MTGSMPVDGVEDASLVVDRDGVIIQVSESFWPWPTNLAPAAAGASMWTAVAPERMSQRKFVLAEVLSTGRAARFVDRVHGRWAQVSVSPLLNGSKEAHVRFVYRDIDVQVRTEEELKRLRLRVLTIQEDERRTISQNLHDELGQGMTALLMQVRALKDVAPTSPELTARVGDATAQVELLTKRMRQIFYRIRPPSLEDTTLAEALADYCVATAHSSGLRIDFDAEAQLPTLDGAKATAVYRLLQESLNNTIKHARAASVWVSLGVEGDAMYLAVEDDGRGFDDGATRPGMGLTGIRERFEMLEGEVQVDSRPGAGTRISGSVPVEYGATRRAP